MPALDISNLSFQELMELKRNVDNRLSKLAGERRQALLKELKELDELSIDGDTPKAPTMYRGPDGQTWSGRGSTPKWLREYEANGGNRNDLRVDRR